MADDANHEPHRANQHRRRQVMSNAAVAGSAAFASTAAIPVIGPEMAPGAAAAAYSATAAFAPMASARNGFDIPAGLNPVTQLHEKEMVLPAKQADVIRNMADERRRGRRRAPARARGRR
jgi:hypothetical protein